MTLTFGHTREHRAINILLCEDNPGDVRLIREVFNETAARLELSVVMDGEEALDYFRCLDGHGKTEMPELIILDLNMPKKDGREVLREIKKNRKLKRIPVIVLTASEAEWDIDTCYELGANCVLTKPINLDQFADMLNTIEKFWLDMVKLPKMESF